MRIALAQINSTLCDFESNSKKIIDYSLKAKSRHCDLVVFPEASLFGYPPFDLLELSGFVDLQEKKIREISKKIPANIGVIFGGFVKNQNKNGRPFYNAAIFLQKNKKAQFFYKELLPVGDVFDESRFVEKGNLEKNILKFRSQRALITICEDIWAWEKPKQRNLYSQNPLLKMKKSKIDFVINLSASPYYDLKKTDRAFLVSKTAKFFKRPVIYVNMVGGQDEIIFDGNSFAVNKLGKKVLQCSGFEEDLGIVDTKKQEGEFERNADLPNENLRKAICLGIRDFVRKNKLSKVHLGLSGGIDSAIVACLAVDALGASNVVGIALPGPFSSAKSLTWAEGLSKNLGIVCEKVEIETTYNFLSQLLAEKLMIKDFSLVHENLQARLRGLILMAIANHRGSLLLGTSNKSELAAGYATLYGDLCAGLLPIGDLTKAQVYDLARHYNSQGEIIPEGIISRAPSAELRPNQKDQDSLPAYDKLDLMVRKIIENSSAPSNKDEKWLFRTLLRSEFKRWQAPPILKVSSHAFGRGRRWPIANKGDQYFL